MVCSDLSGIEIEYQPGEVKQEKKEEGYIITLAEGERQREVREVGEPDLPARIILVGIPLGVRPEVHLLTSSFTESTSEEILPVPRLIAVDSLGAVRQVYEKDEKVYDEDAYWPSNPVEIDNISFLRDQRILCLRINPIQYNPVKKLRRICSQVRFAIYFSGTPKLSKELAEDRCFEDVYRALLWNYESAKNWRRGREISKAPISDPFSGAEVWYKLCTKEEGIYKITYHDLKNAGIDPSQIDPRTIKIYNGGAQPLPKSLTAPRSDSLRQIAIFVSGENDGSFDPSDYVLFYGVGLSGWARNQNLCLYLKSGEPVFLHRNPYTDFNIYWFCWGGANGLRMQALDGTPVGAQFYPSSFVDTLHLEVDKINPFESGLIWFWQEQRREIDQTERTYRFSFETPPLANNFCHFTGTFVGDWQRSGEQVSMSTHRLRVNLNNNLVGNLEWSGDPTAGETKIEGSGNWLNNGQNKIDVTLYKLPTEVGKDVNFLDWFEIVYQRKYQVWHGSLRFRPDTSRAGRYRFSISGFLRKPEVLKIINPFQPSRFINFSFKPDTLIFEDDVDSTDLFFSVDSVNTLSPYSIQLWQPAHLRSSLNGADYLIITPAQFLPPLQRLKEQREKKNGFKVMVIPLYQIYEEFDFGLPDPTAIRDFLRFAVDSPASWNPKPAYCLFVGDASYDYKNLFQWSHPKNLLPCWQVDNLGGQSSFGYAFDGFDDGFVYFNSPNIPQMKIGRIAVQSESELNTVLEKIFAYENPETYGVWRNRVIMVADDERTNDYTLPIETGHTTDTENLANSLPRNIDKTKVYLLEYPLYSSSPRDKPTARAALVKKWNKGALSVSYLGHGAWFVWAHESVLKIDDVPTLSNGKKLPVVFIGSCSVGRFDNIRYDCIAENLVKSPRGGAIATIAATRTSTGSSNAALGQRLFNQLFFNDTTAQGKPVDLGTALFLAKQSGDFGNNRLYPLLGDPGLRFGRPVQKINLALNPDSLKRKATITASSNIPWTSSFRGYGFLNVFDSAYRRDTLSISYILPGNPIFQGPITIPNDSLKINFIVPNYLNSGNLGRASLYVWNNNEDGIGYSESLYVGGIDTTAPIDKIPPQIKLFWNGLPLRNGEEITPQGMFSAVISDENGINTSGQRRYGQIRLFINRNENDLTDRFTYDLDSYQKGSLSYLLSLPEPGEESRADSLMLEVWDNFGNSGREAVGVNVVSSLRLTISRAYNFPNPFKEDTYFTFYLNKGARVNIKIYTVAGRLIRTISNIMGIAGYNQIFWDGKDEEGSYLANGVYLYKIIAKRESGEENEETSIFGKAVMMK
ncbi:MAG: type IX secretion system sortase PorU [Candidatus Edwardsbacteria bacterium]